VVQLAALYAGQQDRPQIGWNFRNGEKIQVICYTNCEMVELFLNGKSAGIKKLSDNADKYYMTWELPFQKGELKAVGTMRNEICESVLAAYGAPAALSLVAVDGSIYADGQDITHIEITALDCDGNLSANACPSVQVSIEGPAVILGIENGDLCDNTPYGSKERRAANGKLLVYIRAGRDKGIIRVKAASPGLLTGEIEIAAV
jgi:hypothetical protein